VRCIENRRFLTIRACRFCYTHCQNALTDTMWSAGLILAARRATYSFVFSKFYIFLLCNLKKNSSATTPGVCWWFARSRRQFCQNSQATFFLSMWGFDKDLMWYKYNIQYLYRYTLCGIIEIHHGIAIYTQKFYTVIPTPHTKYHRRHRQLITTNI